MQKIFYLLKYSFISFLLLISSPCPVHAEDNEDSRTPLPREVDKDLAYSKLNNLFKFSKKRSKDSEKKEFAKKLFTTAKEEPKGSSNQYILYLESQKFAIEANDIDLALEISDTLTKTFQVSTIKEKIKVIGLLEKRTKDRVDKKLLIQETIKVIESARPKAQFETLTSTIKLAQKISKGLKSDWIEYRLDNLEESIKKIGKWRKINEAAKKKLIEEPGDTKSLIYTALFQCLILNRWEPGFKILQSINDKNIQTLIDLEKQEFLSTEEVEQNGQAWFKLANSIEDKFVKEAILQESYQRFLKAKPQLSNLEKLTYDIRLNFAPYRYLSDLEESDVKVGFGKFLKKGHFYENKRIRVSKIYSYEGLTIHSPVRGASQVKYRLNKKYNTFEAVMGLNESAQNLRGSFQFIVVGDERVLWKSKAIGSKLREQKCKVKIKNVDILEIKILTKGRPNKGHTVILDPIVKK